MIPVEDAVRVELETIAWRDGLKANNTEHEAPELFAPLDGDNYETYFVRQSVTSEDLEQTCRAAERCCVGAVRYAGQDAAIIQRLGNTHDYCDYIVADNEELKLLDHWPLRPRRRSFRWQFST